ncbi:MAG: type II toxin-antitoxin system PrlF family antitoxin [Candidatus Omnitrophica bacterium]|nr:type II toxin-antitoxin system PrlF family antitoxin [Candidatus Omnitrophota bacterium]
MAIEYAKLTSKGQVTIPNLVRKMLRLHKDSLIAFRITRDGIVIVPARMVEEKTPYTKEEWAKIEDLASMKGKTCKSGKSAKKYLDSL